MGEMWGRVYCKKTPCWLWHAINRNTGEIIAYVFGTREHEVLQKLLDLLSELNVEIEAVFSDDNFAYHEAIPRNILFTGKRNTWRIERKHLRFVLGLSVWLVGRFVILNRWICIRLFLACL
jgi:insertion element IS1 protein InsB